MTDDRDFSWLGSPAPPPPPTPARALAVLVKDARSVQLVERDHPLGRELVCLMASELLWSQVFRHGQDAAFDAELQAAIEALAAKGWEPAAP